MEIGASVTEADGSLSKKVMPDFLHLSKDGYRRWAMAIEAKVTELLK
jgi:lysophospholipase L1-like esterase